MAEKLRPQYGGVPSGAEAELAARRQRAEDVQVPPPPLAASTPSAVPPSIEQRLKAMERQLAALVNKIDLVIDILGASGPPGADQPQPTPTKRKR